MAGTNSLVPASRGVAHSARYYQDDIAETYEYYLMLVKTILAVTVLVLTFGAGFKAGQWWTWATCQRTESKSMKI